MIENSSPFWPTLAISLSIIGSALGIIVTIWKVILSTVNGHLKDFGEALMGRIEATAEKGNESADQNRKTLIDALRDDGDQTRQTLRDLLPRWTLRK